MPESERLTRPPLADQLASSVGPVVSEVALVICDVDGVLTDGGIYLDGEGRETKKFNVRDGFGIAQWRRAGGRVALLTGRSSGAVGHRAHELGIDTVVQGSHDKGADALRICAALGVAPRHALMVGDDLPDLAAFRACGIGIAVADAVAEVRRAAAGVTHAAGGQGAVREVLDVLLACRDAGPPPVGALDGSVS